MVGGYQSSYSADPSNPIETKFFSRPKCANHPHRALLAFALADMRRTDWVESNVAVCDDPSARIDIDGLFRRF